MRILPARDDALLVELDDLAQATALLASLVETPVPGTGEPVPGARTVLVPFQPAVVTASALAAELRTRPLAPREVTGARLVEIPTVYDGEDLAPLARLLGWSPEELVRRHVTASWRVGFMGFAPGFAYLTCADAPGSWPEVPRRETPRTRVPAGAVALAGPYAGVYPRASPGGWQLVGRTDTPVWDSTREPASLWSPGDEVRFVPTPPTPQEVSGRGTPRYRPGSDDPSPSEPHEPVSGRARDGALRAALVVLDGGLQSLVEDLGRPGVARLGVGSSGAADPRSLRAANRAVGNVPGAAAIECVGGLRVRARGGAVVALTGAGAPTTVFTADRSSERPAPHGVAFLLHDGDELAVGYPGRGARTYLAVRGGLDVPVVLGSRSTDTLGGLGPAPLGPGTVLDVGAQGALEGAVAGGDVGAPPLDRLPAAGETTTLRVVLGPHDDWFDAGAVAALTGTPWTVTPRSDRVGLRLDGEPLHRAVRRVEAELPSAGTVTGALQVPPDGRPVLLLADHPVTGGYPVVAAVVAADVALAGQLPAGATVRFAVVPTSLLA
ncbi:carboxyltransferase domain-containing protein [Xylanimonas sp. McL0601]|uniref:5-oxoprolinase subunit B/C family protein n=1 Tax=Xylanimonas sp. McL0601 TaxID=3414739 RepID=UPI003CF5A548